MRTRGGVEGDLGGNNLNFGICENGKLLSFWFSFHSAIPEKFSKTTLSLHVLTSG